MAPGVRQSGSSTSRPSSPDPHSLLNVYRRLLELRKGSAALQLGSYLGDHSSTDEVFVYLRASSDQVMTVALNFADTEVEVSVESGRVLFSSIEPEAISDMVRPGGSGRRYRLAVMMQPSSGGEIPLCLSCCREMEGTSG